LPFTRRSGQRLILLHGYGTDCVGCAWREPISLLGSLPFRLVSVPVLLQFLHHLFVQFILDIVQGAVVGGKL
jgi:hypothetical protein